MHDATVAMLPNGLQFASARTGLSPVQTVPACPVQIRAHHHIDGYTDINKLFIHFMTTEQKYTFVMEVFYFVVRG